MKNELNDLISKLDESFQGRPWFGDSLMRIINSVDFQLVNARPSGTQNSIARLVQHIINWRIFVIKKLERDAVFDIKRNDSNDWSEIEIRNEKEWRDLLQALQESQEKIKEILKTNDPSLLTNTVPGREYDYHYLIEGIIQHDIYHLGQIALVKKLTEGNNQLHLT